MKSRGEAFLEALQKRTRLTTTGVLFCNLPQWTQDAYNEAAAEYDKAVATDLPADVAKFVSHIEAVSRDEVEDDAQHLIYSSMPQLCDIIRKQAAELALRRANRFVGRHEEETGVYCGDYNQHRETGWACNGCGSFSANEHDPCDNCDNTCVRLENENAHLHDRLAKLESATRGALNLLGPEYFDDGKPLADLGRLVNIKGNANG